jgi:ubiquinone/menaquinone biosynthesis C-methylase UbiE
MKEFDPIAYKKKVKAYQDRDDPTGWFDSIYTDAQGDHKAVKNCSFKHQGRKAIVIGCGVGDDAEALSETGYEVIAFDISPEAIRLCKKRYPDTTVNYLVADLFDYPPQWVEFFELVYECNTIQVLPGEYRLQARDAMVSLMAPQGYLLVIKTR